MKREMDGKRVFVTGAAGFIGFHLSRALLARGARVTGFDNCNDYYDVRLKRDRLAVLAQMDGFDFIAGDLADEGAVRAAFSAAQPEYVVHLAAQAGVRYSIDHPRAYLESNVIGFFNVLEALRAHPVGHFIYASSSSVYGNQQKVPFSVDDRADRPISLYAATKRADELFASCYAHLYGIPSTGLRFFTVYGPYGRPDMAYFKFTKRILAGEPIDVYNNGDLYRDFTYVDDVIAALVRMIPAPPDASCGCHRVYNIGNNRPESLLVFIETLEALLSRKAEKRFLPMQPGDVYQTFADVDALRRDFAFAPDTKLADGLRAFTDWYLDYYKLG